MTIDELRCALRGVAAYRHIVDAPLMGLTLELLDRLGIRGWNRGGGTLCPAVL